ncbi:hypothetical protein KBD59_00365 [Candidatus Gracilibacteria bacterium]|nr:hypothetical protein [Candidatus Gracilibacteria bacterium]
MTHPSDLSNLEQRITKIEERNRSVELDKKWEGSWTRRILLAVFTYLAVLFYFIAIGLEAAFLSALVPTIGFMLSTLTLPYFKKMWIKYF